MNSTIIKDIKEYEKIAQKILKYDAGPNIIALVGDLGTGKTTFAKFIGKSVGATQEIISPTFIIHREYLTSEPNKIFHHFDLYRLDHEFELDEIGIRTLLKNHNVIVIEWADKFRKYIDSFLKKSGTRVTWVELEYIDETTRKVTL